MKRIIAVLLAVFAFLSLTGFSTQDPAFEKTGQVKNTVDLTEANGKKMQFVTRGYDDNANDVVTCGLTAKWVKVQDAATNSTQDAVTFWVPESVDAPIVKVPGIAKYLKDIDGYEWRCMQYTVSASSSFSTIATYEDYYLGYMYDENFKYSDDGLTAYGDFELEVDGKVYPDCFIYTSADMWLDYEKKLGITEETVMIRIPEGYDGCIVGLTDTRKMKRDADGGVEFDPDLRGDTDVYYRLR